jgi:hypothetical protein
MDKEDLSPSPAEFHALRVLKTASVPVPLYRFAEPSLPTAALLSRKREGTHDPCPPLHCCFPSPRP